MPLLLTIAARSLMQHRRRSLLLASVVALVTALLLILSGIFNAMQTNLLTTATTLMSGYVNVGGFYKVRSSQSAPIVVDAQKVEQTIRNAIPELTSVTWRGRGWAKMISDSRSIQVGIGGIDIDAEPEFRKVVRLTSGNLDGLRDGHGVMIFEGQAKQLNIKVGDRVTYAAATPRGTNNTLDVTVVAIAKDMGMLSQWNTFVSNKALRELYQLNDNTIGVLQVYVKDLKNIEEVAKRLRKALADNNYTVMNPDPRAFFFKFEDVNRESWTGQRIDVTTWEDETSFVRWFSYLLGVTFSVVIGILIALISVGIMNVMFIAIRERTREIGTLRAIGMQRRSVLGMFVTEGFLLGAIGAIVGVAFGILFTVLINALHIPLPQGAQLLLMAEYLSVLPSVKLVIFALAFIPGVITLVSINPSRTAARLEPITAMSHIG